jgi:hypothetical protein
MRSNNCITSSPLIDQLLVRTSKLVPKLLHISSHSISFRGYARFMSDLQILTPIRESIAVRLVAVKHRIHGADAFALNSITQSDICAQPIHLRSDGDNRAFFRMSSGKSSPSGDAVFVQMSSGHIVLLSHRPFDVHGMLQLEPTLVNFTLQRLNSVTTKTLQKRQIRRGHCMYPRHGELRRGTRSKDHIHTHAHTHTHTHTVRKTHAN